MCIFLCFLVAMRYLGLTTFPPDATVDYLASGSILANCTNISKTMNAAKTFLLKCFLRCLSQPQELKDVFKQSVNGATTS